MPDMPPQLAVMKAVRTMIETVTGKPCGLGEPPRAAPVPPSTERLVVAPPYTILYDTIGGQLSAPTMDGKFNRADWPIQVTYVSAKDDRQLLWLRDRTRAAMLDRNPDGSWVHPVSVVSWVVTRAHIEDGGRDSEGGIVSSAERYMLTVEPA